MKQNFLINKKSITGSTFLVFVVLAISGEKALCEKCMPVSLPNHFDSYQTSPFGRLTIDGNLFAHRVRLKQGSETELEKAQSGSLLTKDEYDCLYSDKLEQALLTDRFGKGKFSSETLQNAEEVKRLMRKITKLKDISFSSKEQARWSNDLVTRNIDNEDFADELIASCESFINDLISAPVDLTDSIDTIFNLEEAMQDLRINDKRLGHEKAAEVYQKYPLILKRDLEELAEGTTQFKRKSPDAYAALLIMMVNRKIDDVINCFEENFENMKTKLQALTKEKIYDYFKVCSRVFETKFQHLFENEDKKTMKDLIIDLIKATEKFSDKPEYKKRSIREIATTTADNCASEAVVFEIHDPRLSYIFNYDGKNNTEVDVYDPAGYENLKHHSVLSLISAENPKMLTQFLTENKLSLKDLAAILEHDLFVAKNRVAFHLVKEIENCLIEIYNLDALYGPENDQIDPASAIAEINAEKTGHLLGSGRNILFDSKSLLFSGKNPVQDIIKIMIFDFKNVYLSDLPIDNDLSLFLKIFSGRRIQLPRKSRISLISKNYWAGLLNQRISENPLEYMKPIRQECGWFMSRLREGEDKTENNFRENTCFLSSVFPYYTANRQFPGIFWFQDLANKNPAPIVSSSEPLRELTLEEVMRGKDFPLTPRTMRAISSFLDLNVSEYRVSSVIASIRTENNPADYINPIATGSFYSPVINCIESKREPISFNGEKAERGHFNFLRFNRQLDDQRSSLENWFIVNSKNLYGAEETPEKLKDQELPRFYQLNPDNEAYFLSGRHMKNVYGNAFMTEDKIINDFVSELYKQIINNSDPTSVMLNMYKETDKITSSESTKSSDPDEMMKNFDELIINPNPQQ